MDPATPSTTETDSRSAPPTFDTRRVRAMVRRSLLSQSRNPDFWFLLLVLPLVDGLLFGSIGVAYGIGDAPVVLLVTGIMLFHLIWQLTLAGSFGLLDEVWSRNLLNLIATPLTEREMLSSFGVVGLLRTGVSVTVIGAVGVVFFAVSPTSAGVVLVPSAALLLLFGWSVALFVVGLTLQYGDRAEVFSWGTLVLLMPLSGVFYPVESLPPVLQAVARAIPLTHVFDAVRIGIEDGEVAWAQLAVAAAGTAVIAAASTWFVAHQLRRFRRDGWVTRFV
ncbi:MAG TPA: ABC transporter permease [Microthrixaceae bacterium]|nr:ABC transporter permease [Microthrixaceae bacterium]HMU79589.1 ABC transporter permease [Microthrixaceae bacterium]HMY86154.1 ABC transporter permease [Microthrixaceae bacterium]HNB94463.1 ABC transporter permease [Microthrixaceae bacterium]HNE36026.1 ABC transporter permease [Microthrixaceae bacterium]